MASSSSRSSSSGQSVAPAAAQVAGTYLCRRSCQVWPCACPVMLSWEGRAPQQSSRPPCASSYKSGTTRPSTRSSSSSRHHRSSSRSSRRRCCVCSCFRRHGPTGTTFARWGSSRRWHGCRCCASWLLLTRLSRAPVDCEFQKPSCTPCNLVSDPENPDQALVSWAGWTCALKGRARVVLCLLGRAVLTGGCCAGRCHGMCTKLH